MRRIVILHYTIWLDLIQYELNRCFNSNNKRPNGFELTEIPRSLGGEVPCSLGEAARFQIR